MKRNPHRLHKIHMSQKTINSSFRLCARYKQLNLLIDWLIIYWVSYFFDFNSDGWWQNDLVLDNVKIGSNANAVYRVFDWTVVNHRNFGGIFWIRVKTPNQVCHHHHPGWHWPQVIHILIWLQLQLILRVYQAVCLRHWCQI